MHELTVIKTDRYFQALAKLREDPVLWFVAATTIGEPIAVLRDENGPRGDFALEAEEKYDQVRKEWKGHQVKGLYDGPRYPGLVAEAALMERDVMFGLLRQLGRLDVNATEDDALAAFHLFWDAVMDGKVRG